MRSMVTVAVTVLACVLLALLTPTSAFAYSSAPLTVCNKVNFDLSVAYGYHSPGVNDPADHSLLTGPFVSRGWRTVPVGQCVTIENPFNARYMYWYVATVNGMFGDDDPVAMRNASGRQHFCVPNYVYPSGGNAPAYSVPTSAFVYEDQNQSADACDTSVTPVAHNFWVTARETDTWVNATVDYTPQMVSHP